MAINETKSKYSKWGNIFNNNKGFFNVGNLPSKNQLSDYLRNFRNKQLFNEGKSFDFTNDSINAKSLNDFFNNGQYKNYAINGKSIDPSLGVTVNPFDTYTLNEGIDLPKLLETNKITDEALVNAAKSRDLGPLIDNKTTFDVLSKNNALTKGTGYAVVNGNTTVKVMDPSKGIQVSGSNPAGPTVSNVANVGSGLVQGGRAIKNVIDNTNTGSDFEDLKNKVSALQIYNPLYGSYLTPEDEKLLREAQNGTLEGQNWTGLANGLVRGIPSAALQAGLGFLTGGGVGAAINGIGGLVNSSLEGMGTAQNQNLEKLNALYSKLQQANSEYQSMKRPSRLGSAGLSSRAYSSLY